jgi:hypothetical protein
MEQDTRGPSIRRRLGLPERGPVRAYDPAVNSGNRHEAPRGSRPVRRKEGHDALIQTLAGRNTRVFLEMLDLDEVIEGRLLQSDRFTVSVVVDENAPPVLVFKHAIRTMRFETAPGAPADQE